MPNPGYWWTHPITGITSWQPPTVTTNITSEPRPSLVDSLDVAKRDKLTDILCRLIANPGNVSEVADELSRDWFPMMKVDPTGKIDYVLGTGHKK